MNRCKKHSGRGKKPCCMLSEVNAGRCCRIRNHLAKGAVRQRLLDLGFIPETTVEVVRRAPLGDPIECNIANYKVALRGSEAQLIEVECD